jgi:glycosyltransferase involved in cell wall biosynthesis
MTAKITVAIPAYNSQLSLRETLESVLAQTVPAYEIIVVDDESTDGTEEIARSFGDRIRYIKQANQGIAGARNTAIQHATGDWIAFLDHDDLMVATKLEKQLGIVESNPDLAVVYSTFTYLYADGSTSEVPVFPAKDLWPAIRYRTPILPSTALVKRSALLEIGGFRKFYGTDDWDLWFRLLRRFSAKAFQEIPESLTFYRWWEKNESRNFMPIAGQVLLMLDTILLDGLTGWKRAIWKRKIEAKIYYGLSLSLRTSGSDRYWEYAIASMFSWPFWGDVVTAHRYRVLAHMLYTRLRSPRLRLRYWWPIRRCREGLTKAS